MTVGIYGIFQKDKCVYVGQSKNIASRWKQHRFSLEQNKHANGYLQRVFNKYGELDFRILEICNSKKLCIKEREWIKKLDPQCNLMVVRDSDGLQHTAEWKKEMSINNPSKRPEVKELRRQQMLKNNPMRNENTRKKVSVKIRELYASGQLKPPKHRWTESEKKRLSEIKQNISARTRQKMSIAQKNRFKREKEEGIVRVNPMAGKRHTQQTREKLSAIMKEKAKNRERDKCGRFVKE